MKPLPVPVPPVTVPPAADPGGPGAGRANARAYHLGVTFARDERTALCALLDETGPGAPTLCEGWRTVDLAAHLVLRERRPDAAAGVMGGPLAGYTQRVQRGLIARMPYRQLVDEFRNGPPKLSAFRIPGVDERANVVEFFVHHEDVRRAQPDWQPRELEHGLAERSAAEDGRIKQFREATREHRIEIARELEHATPRKVAWGGRCGDTNTAFTSLAALRPRPAPGTLGGECRLFTFNARHRDRRAGLRLGTGPGA